MSGKPLARLLLATAAMAVLALPAHSARGADFYVALGGGPAGDGSKERPWDLATALAHPPALRPGDTVWVRGGTYRGAYTSRLEGEPDAPITLRQFPGERAIIDGSGNARAVLTIFGAWTTYWGFEITNSDRRRKSSLKGSAPPDLSRGTSHGIIVKAPHSKLINLVVHDTGVGIGFWSEARDSELYGNIIFYNGWDGPDRGHGHGIYTQNESGTKKIADNIIFHQFGSGLIAYGSERAFLNNFLIAGNVLFNNGGLSETTGYARNLLVGGGNVAENPVIIENYTYFSPDPRAGIEAIALHAGARNAVIKRNYFVHGTTPQLTHGRALQLGAVYGLEMVDNVFQGAIIGFAPDLYPDNRYYDAQNLARGARVFVRRNLYDAQRAHIIVYNFDHLPAVAVDPAPYVRRGERYVIIDVQDVFGPPLAVGTYDGRPIMMPMRLSKVTAPIGPARRPRHTAPEFAVFLLVKR